MTMQKSDFSHLGYEIHQELGRNRFGGRITHLAEVENPSNQVVKNKVVIKEFRFADVGTDWSGFKAYEREIEVLQQLDHPRIPRYLSSFETSTGFCLVQEYKDAPSLAVNNNFTAQQVKQIATSVLEILVYLQQRTPQIIHRDIKPENILVDKNLNAYLVDFGFARVTDGEIALSSIASGTPGFIPPEEYVGRNLTEASDLYSLGVTLICLLSNTRSVDVARLIDDNHRFDFKSLRSHLNPQFVEWLRQMVEPNIKNRFTSASVALESLKKISFTLKSDRIKVVSPKTELNVIQGIKFLGIIWLLNLVSQGIENVSISQQQQRQIQQQRSQISRLLSKQQRLEYRINKLDRIQREQRIRNFRRWNQPYNSSLPYFTQPNNTIPFNNQKASLIAKLQTTKECNNCDLKNVNLANFQLSTSNLKNVNLAYSNLVNANFNSSDLSSANLRYTNLENTRFKNTNLQNANLRGAKLRNANLSNTNLSNANLMYANLYNADLRGADLRGVKLSRTTLNGADLRGANLRYTNLERVNLSNVKLQGAIMPDGKKHE